MKKFWQKPYPLIHENRPAMVGITLFILLFVFGFLYFFKPFNIVNRIPPDESLFEVCMAFGLVSAVTYALYVVLPIHLFPNLISEKTWTVGKELIYTNLLLFMISFTNVFVADIYNVDEVNGEIGFLPFCWDSFYHTYMIGIFPVALVTMLNNYVKLQRNLNRAREQNERLKEHAGQADLDEPVEITIDSQIKSNQLTVNLNELLFVMSDGNYVEYYIRNGEGDVRREIQRNTLTSIQHQLAAYDQFFRSHRAYIVNLRKIKSSSGNAQGLQLSFHDTDHQVPVSRQKLNDFDEVFERVA